MGKPVYSPDEFLKQERENIMVIVAMEHSVEVKKNLVFAGFVDGVNLFSYYDFHRIYESIFYLYRFNKLCLYNISLVVTALCSLKCEHCVGLSTYRQHEGHILDYPEAVRQIDFRFDKFDYIFKFNLLGGEAFLHPQLAKIADYVLTNYSSKIDFLHIYTNGLFPALSDDVLRVLKNENVIVGWSDYTAAVDDKRIADRIKDNIKFLREQGICVRNTPTTEWYDFKFGEAGEDSDELGLRAKYTNCSRCAGIRGADLYSCVYAKDAAGYVNGTDTVNEQDFIHLPNENNKAVILEHFLGYTERGYLDMCKYCAGYGRTVNKNIVPQGRQLKDM